MRPGPGLFRSSQGLQQTVDPPLDRQQQKGQHHPVEDRPQDIGQQIQKLHKGAPVEKAKKEQDRTGQNKKRCKARRKAAAEFSFSHALSSAQTLSSASFPASAWGYRAKTGPMQSFRNSSTCWGQRPM